MKRYKPVFMTEHEEGDWVSYEKFLECEKVWRDWNGRAANRAAVLEAEIAELHASIAAIHNEYRSDVVAASKFRDALHSIAENTCCDGCREAALVAQEALKNETL